MATYTGADRALAFLFEMVSNLAEDYDRSSTYAADAYVIYSGTLYKCISAINTPEDFTPAHWQAVLVMDEVAAGGGGGGGGTTVIANPAGAATDILNKIQVDTTIYDVPRGGESSHNYSTTEHVVGTWIDGKNIYEKTIDCGYLPNNSTKNIPHGISDLSKIISWDGGIITDSGAYTPIPYVHTDGIQYAVSVLATDTNISISTKTNRSTWYAYITLKYTHTVDTTVYTRVLENGTDTRTTENGTDTRTTENIAGA